MIHIMFILEKLICSVALISGHQCLSFKLFVEINLHKCFEFMF